MVGSTEAKTREKTPSETNRGDMTGGYALPTYHFVPPPELSGQPCQRYPVVIVGAGLSGLALACDLAVRGVQAVVLDEDDTVGVRGASSRGIVYAQKTLEIFARFGMFERVRDKGVVWSKGKTLAGNNVVYEFDAASATASLQPPFINLQQFYVEWFLVDRIVEIGRTDLRWKNRVTAAEDRGDHVMLSVTTPAGDYQIEAQWLVDACGLHSLIRDGFGVKKDDAARTPDRWCIADVRLKKPLPIERWTWIEAPFNEDRAVWQHLMADDVWRMDFQMAPDADPEVVSRPDVAADRIRRQLGEDAEFELVWVGPYAYRSYIIDRFRHGRTLIIGDAAHVVSPFGARGGNSGIQDADNLGWKLALVLAREAPETILDSYHDERAEAAEVNRAVTDRTARFLAPRSVAEHAIRRAAISLARDYAFARPLVNTGRLSVPNIYTRSRTVSRVDDHGGQSLQNIAVVLPDGHRAGLMDFVRSLGTRFIGVWFAPADVSAQTVAAFQALECDGVPVTIVNAGVHVAGMPYLGDPTGALRTAIHPSGARRGASSGAPGEGGFGLIRPDLHLAGFVANATADVAALLLARALRSTRDRHDTQRPPLLAAERG